jgi:hypothetical protein
MSLGGVCWLASNKQKRARVPFGLKFFLFTFSPLTLLLALGLTGTYAALVTAVGLSLTFQVLSVRAADQAAYDRRVMTAFERGLCAAYMFILVTWCIWLCTSQGGQAEQELATDNANADMDTWIPPLLIVLAGVVCYVAQLWAARHSHHSILARLSCKLINVSLLLWPYYQLASNPFYLINNILVATSFGDFLPGCGRDPRPGAVMCYIVPDNSMGKLYKDWLAGNFGSILFLYFLPMFLFVTVLNAGIKLIVESKVFSNMYGTLPYYVDLHRAQGSKTQKLVIVVIIFNVACITTTGIYLLNLRISSEFFNECDTASCGSRKKVAVTESQVEAAKLAVVQTMGATAFAAYTLYKQSTEFDFVSKLGSKMGPVKLNVKTTHTGVDVLHELNLALLEHFLHGGQSKFDELIIGTPEDAEIDLPSLIQLCAMVSPDAEQVPKAGPGSAREDTFDLGESESSYVETSTGDELALCKNPGEAGADMDGSERHISSL